MRAPSGGVRRMEIETGSGKRGRRDDGITRLVAELTGGEAACVVNNNAGATLIALAALAEGNEQTHERIHKITCPNQKPHKESTVAVHP